MIASHPFTFKNRDSSSLPELKATNYSYVNYSSKREKRGWRDAPKEALALHAVDQELILENLKQRSLNPKSRVAPEQCQVWPPTRPHKNS